jgi:hypothetical protein
MSARYSGTSADILGYHLGCTGVCPGGRHVPLGRTAVPFSRTRVCRRTYTRMFGTYSGAFQRHSSISLDVQQCVPDIHEYLSDVLVFRAEALVWRPEALVFRWKVLLLVNLGETHRWEAVPGIAGHDQEPPAWADPVLARKRDETEVPPPPSSHIDRAYFSTGNSFSFQALNPPSISITGKPSAANFTAAVAARWQTCE